MQNQLSLKAVTVSRPSESTNWKVHNYLYFPIGDEIFSINGIPVQGMTHQEAISHFKEVKQGTLVIVLGRRNGTKKKVVNFED